MKTKILMFGWELPPYNSGGLGVACDGILKALQAAGNDITFVLPHQKKPESVESNIVYFDQTSHLKIKTIVFDSIISSYLNEEIYSIEVEKSQKQSIYAPNLIAEVYRYADVVDQITDISSFDIIHCHDWLTLPAALRAKQISNKPLILHIHATEIDRTGNNANQQIFEIEKDGMNKADKIIAVSNFTKQTIINNYGVDESKIEVIHNGIDCEAINHEKNSKISQRLSALKRAGYQIVLFTGRLTFQKGVDYLLQAAKKSLQYNSKSLFIIAGSGDMEKQLIRQASRLKISDKVIFTGFIRGQELQSLYQIADLFIMPSVSEPFGLVALESAVHHTPIIVSKQSGVSEVLSNSLKVDFWDVDEMADKIVAVLEYEGLQKTLSSLAHDEVKSISWNKAGDKILSLYRNLILKQI